MIRLLFLADLGALLLAEKHETQPSTLKMSKFSETIHIDSASSWNKIHLDRFGVEYGHETDTPLNDLITDPKYYDPTTEQTRNFAERTILIVITDNRL